MGEFKIHKNTVIFKINISKLIDKHPKLMKSFLKNCFKDSKQICQENSSEFELVKRRLFKKTFLKLSL